MGRGGCANMYCDERLNEMCTLLGFYCRFFAHGLAVALVLSSLFFFEDASTLAAFSLGSGLFILSLESSWCCFHSRCWINRFPVCLDSYLLRSLLYTLVSAAGICIHVYLTPQIDLFIMMLMLGALGLMFALAHVQRPPSIYEEWLDVMEARSTKSKIREAVADGDEQQAQPLKSAGPANV